jgi:hypothetical protein
MTVLRGQAIRVRSNKLLPYFIPNMSTQKKENTNGISVLVVSRKGTLEKSDGRQHDVLRKFKTTCFDLETGSLHF